VLSQLAKSQIEWQETPGDKRMKMLEDLASALLAEGSDELVKGAQHFADFAGISQNGFVAPVRLPGPTGETNDLELLGRGVYLVQADQGAEPGRVMRHVAAAVAAGNAVLLAGNDKWLSRLEKQFAAHDLPKSLLRVVGDDAGLATMYGGAIAGVSCVAPLPRVTVFKQVLARRDGAILSLISDSGIEDDGALPGEMFMHRFATEKIVTINTTAAGGNASLMSMEEA
jgi:RHH-type proline utilization regulon transcriptional repressor/proline dehydrogenase/delta 1-pyrroline-5-carboxylate dehydrogenase